MSLTVHLGLVFHIFIAVAIMVMVCGHRGLWPSWNRPGSAHRASLPLPRNVDSVPMPLHSTEMNMLVF